MTTRTLLADSIARIAADRCPSSVARRDEAGGEGGSEGAVELWREIAAASLDRATAPESAGGASLAWRDVLPLVSAVGEFAMPVPLAESLGAHALAAAAGLAPPEAAASFAKLRRDGDLFVADAVPWGDRVAAVVGVLADGSVRVLDAGRSTSRHERNQAGEVRSMMTWTTEVGDGDARAAVPAAGQAGGGASPGPLRRAAFGASALACLGAALRAAQIAGALRSVLRMTVRHAGEREQFGRPIGRFQAVQQQLALMAELVAQASIGAELAFDCDEPLPDPMRAACAKQVASANALQCVAIAHAVHGAIGVTAEHDLQLFTRRLRAWAGEWGGAHHWALVIGRAALQSDHPSLWHEVVEVSRSGGAARPSAS